MRWEEPYILIDYSKLENQGSVYRVEPPKEDYYGMAAFVSL